MNIPSLDFGLDEEVAAAAVTAAEKAAQKSGVEAVKH